MPCKNCAQLANEPVPPVTRMELADIWRALLPLSEIRRNDDKDSKIAARLATAMFYLQAASAFKPESAIRTTLEGLFDHYIEPFENDKTLNSFRSSL